MTEETTESPQENTPQQEPLGNLLKEYRESAELDIDQAADALRLTPSILTALEEENFKNLPEAPYVRGYLRGYAKLADKDPQTVISLYDELRGGVTEDLSYNFAPSYDIQKVAKPTISPLVIRLGLTAAAVLALVVLSMIPGVRDWADTTWNQFSKQTTEKFQAQEEEKPKPNTEEARIISSTAEVSTPKANGSTPSSTTTTEQATASTTTGNQSTVTTSTTAEKEKPETQETNNNTASTEKQAETTQTTISPDKVTVATNITPTETANQAATASNPTQANDTQTNITEGHPVDLSAVNMASGEAHIKLVFEKDVWMQIKDKQGKSIFEGLHTANSEQELKAGKPLKFKVGNAPGVKIYVNGQLFDTTEITRGSVAKFTVE